MPSLPWANPTIFRDAVRKVNTVYVSLERPICAPIWGESAKWLILLGPQIARAQILDNYQVGDGISTQIPENNGERGKLGVDFEFPKTRNPKMPHVQIWVVNPKVIIRSPTPEFSHTFGTRLAL